jgi:hypothetical protein
MQRSAMAANDRFEWVAGNLGAIFVDPNSWIRDGDFRRDGLHLNSDGDRQLGDLYCRVCGTVGDGRNVIKKLTTQCGWRVQEGDDRGIRSESKSQEF